MQVPYDPRGDTGDPVEDVQPRKATVTTQATRIWSALGAGDVLLVNRSLTVAVHVGDSSVDTGSLPVPALGSVVVPAGREWFAVTDTGSAVLWAVPGATSYTPSPAETAAQIAAQPLDVSGSTVGVSGVASPVDVSGSSVGVTGAAAGTSPGGTPDFASRSVTASGTASASLSGGLGTNTATLIPAPGLGVKLELHAGTVTVNCFPTSTAGVETNVYLLRHDTGAVLWHTILHAAAGGAVTDNVIPIDFQGVALPNNVAVDLQIVVQGSTGVTGRGTANLNYTAVS